MESLARRIAAAGDIETAEDVNRHEDIAGEVRGLVRDMTGFDGGPEGGEDLRGVMSILIQMSRPGTGGGDRGRKGRGELVECFLTSFGDREYAAELLDLGRSSYRLRDDDNIILGSVEGQVNRALREARRRVRLDGRYGEGEENGFGNVEEVLNLLRGNPVRPAKPAVKPPAPPRVTARARQIRGQPAGGGIARGAARVVAHREDLFAFRRGEILVCDAIDPNMTFVIPLAAAVVERRGGMLIHGAIIAREYGLPCVTGVPDAARMIGTGDEITVDGYYGLVTIHTGTFGDEGGEKT
jgi:pyruvate,water dikinase